MNTDVLKPPEQRREMALHTIEPIFAFEVTIGLWLLVKGVRIRERA